MRGKVEINGRIIARNDPTLILCDKAHLTVHGGIGIEEGGSFTVTGQKNDTGILTVCDVASGNAGIGTTGNGAIKNIVIDGGCIDAYGGEYGAGVGAGRGGSVDAECS